MVTIHDHSGRLLEPAGLWRGVGFGLLMVLPFWVLVVLTTTLISGR